MMTIAEIRVTRRCVYWILDGKTKEQMDRNATCGKYCTFPSNM